MFFCRRFSSFNAVALEEQEDFFLRVHVEINFETTANEASFRVGGVNLVCQGIPGPWVCPPAREQLGVFARS